MTTMVCPSILNGRCVNLSCSHSNDHEQHDGCVAHSIPESRNNYPCPNCIPTWVQQITLPPFLSKEEMTL